MKRFGYAIKTGGDREIAGALAAGIVRGTRPAPVDAVRRVAMGQHTPEEWDAMVTQARYDYGQTRPLPRPLEWLLVGYALICYGVSRAYHAQDRLFGRCD